jgi:hypothetical protein
MSEINDELVRDISAFNVPEIPDVQIADRDILSSSLQKSLRRAHYPCALIAAKGLVTDPQYFWRRLVTIAFEDFGLSDLALTAQVVEVAKNRTWRMRMGGELRVAAYFIRKLTLTPTDRRIDDLYMLAVAALKYSEVATSFQNASERAKRLVTHAMTLCRNCERAVPMRSFMAVIPATCDQEILSKADLTPAIATLCINGRKVSQCLLPVLLPAFLLDASGAQDQCVLKTQALSDTSYAGVLPAAIDGYTAAGRAILQDALRDSRPLSSILARTKGVSAAKAAAAILFCIEGGLLRNQLSDQLSDELNQLGHGCWSGLPLRLIPEALCLMREHLPIIDAHRQEFLAKRASLINSTKPQEQ